MMDDYEDGSSTHIYSLRRNWEKLKQNSRHLENLFCFSFHLYPLIPFSSRREIKFLYGLNCAWIEIYV
jgi:hypothetical protein